MQTILDGLRIEPHEIQKTFLYRTSQSLPQYIDDTSGTPERRSTTGYVFTLLARQRAPILAIQAAAQNNEHIQSILTRLEQEGKMQSREYLQTALSAVEPEQYADIIKTIQAHVSSSQAEKEFITAYFNDLYYAGATRDAQADENHVAEYAILRAQNMKDIQEIMDHIHVLDM